MEQNVRILVALESRLWLSYDKRPERRALAWRPASARRHGPLAIRAGATHGDTVFPRCTHPDGYCAAPVARACSLRAFDSTQPPLLPESSFTKLAGLADQRLSAMDEMRAALEEASSRQPVLVALDDLQWADPSTLMALGSLPPALFSYPVVWLLARRPWPAPAPLDLLIERLFEAGAIRVHMGPLSEAEAAALAGELAEPGRAAGLARLVAQAEGNPLYLIELMKAGGLPRAADAGTWWPTRLVAPGQGQGRHDNAALSPPARAEGRASSSADRTEAPENDPITRVGRGSPDGDGR
jgi:hypothetical protein